MTFQKSCLERGKKYGNKEAKSSSIEASISQDGYNSTKALTMMENYFHND